MSILKIEPSAINTEADFSLGSLSVSGNVNIGAATIAETNSGALAFTTTNGQFDITANTVNFLNTVATTEIAPGGLGAAGYAGSRGYTGSRGTDGIIGSDGYTGSRGNTGLGFAIAKSYASVAALTADTAPTGIAAGQFAIIETGSVNDADNSKLYLWSGTAYSYVTDLSGAAGITGPAGSTGFTGSAGTAGVNGFTGSAGAAGFTGSGSTGFTGSAGAAGFTGSAGTGFTGSAGVGFTGSAGTAGSVGFAGSAGFTGSAAPLNLPVNTQTSAYTLTAADIGDYVNITTGGVTVPAGVFVSGDVISIYNNSASSQTITTTAVTCYLVGTATTGNRTLAQRGLATLLCVGTNEFVISGGGLT
jgi:hypothetical protein